MSSSEKDPWDEFHRLLQNENHDELGDPLSAALRDRAVFMQLFRKPEDQELIVGLLRSRVGQNLALVARTWYTNHRHSIEAES